MFVSVLVLYQVDEPPVLELLVPGQVYQLAPHCMFSFEVLRINIRYSVSHVITSNVIKLHSVSIVSKHVCQNLLLNPNWFICSTLKSFSRTSVNPSVE